MMASQPVVMIMMASQPVWRWSYNGDGFPAAADDKMKPFRPSHLAGSHDQIEDRAFFVLVHLVLYVKVWALIELAHDLFQSGLGISIHQSSLSIDDLGKAKCHL